MEMLGIVIAVLMAAVLSSALTVWLLHWVFENRVRDELEDAVDAKLSAAMAELSVLIREKVRQGVLDGVAAIPSAEVLKGTGRTVTDTAADLVKGGISALLGGSDLEGLEDYEPAVDPEDPPPDGSPDR